MSRRSVYLILGALTVLVFLYLLILGPEVEERQEAYVWKESWSKIRYEKPGDDAATRTLVRRAHFFKDEFFVKSGKEEQFFPGGYSVTNIFIDWDKLKLLGSYTVENSKLTSYGITDQSPRVLFYKNENGDPVTIRIGNRNGGNLFITSSLPEHKDRLLIISGYMADKFSAAPLSFRENRLLTYSADQYDEELEIHYGENASSSIVLKQKKRKKEDHEEFYWIAEDGSEIPVQFAAPLDNFCKQIQIFKFNDDPDVASLGQARTLWNESRDDMVIRVSVAKGGETTIRFRSPNKPLVFNNSPLVLVGSSSGDTINYAEKRIRDGILLQIENIRKRQQNAPHR